MTVKTKPPVTLADADALLEQEAKRLGIPKAKLLRQMANKPRAGNLVGVRVSPEMKAFLEREAEATGQSIPDVVRHAVEVAMSQTAAVRRLPAASPRKG